jgi:DNA-binding beta-propeller fold protein YncE
MRYEAGAETPGAARVWPAPPETPRYRYAGELTGEANFRPEAEAPRQGAKRVLAWLVGLGQEQRTPVVLQRPQGGAVDPQGRVYVTDVSRRAVYVFDPADGRLEVWEAAGEARRFVAPIGVALGPDGDVLVTDAELGVVVRLGRDGRPRGAFGGGVLQRPTGIVRDAAAGRVYVADTRANQVLVFDDRGGLITRWGEPGDGPGALNAPTYLALYQGQVLVSDTLNARVQVFTADGRLLRSFGERGLYVGNLVRPKGLAVDGEGHIYVVESYYDHLLVFDQQGRLLLPIGGSGQRPGQFYLPAGVWTDGGDRVFVADMFNGRVSVFDYLGGTP